ncbi:MAG: hypothetical protein ISEC1_P0611 [Thiomicrorhabdus sp.]|nr:MAG: hypothetical protein ISEC1_P0611 [Thiomicrorhabdus sp.]
MGYMLNSLGNLPIEDDIEVYIFVVNGNWQGGFYDLIEKNFSNIARKIGSNAIIAKGLDQEQWTNEVAEKYFGENAGQLFQALPALLLTSDHPENISKESYKLIVPLRDVESRFGDWDVFFKSLTKLAQGDDTEFLERFEDVEDLIDKGNSVIELKPNFFGIGINLNALIAKVRG